MQLRIPINTMKVKINKIDFLIYHRKLITPLEKFSNYFFIWQKKAMDVKMCPLLFLDSPVFYLN